MAEQKISSFAETTTLADGDQLTAVKSGVNVKILWSNIKAYFALLTGNNTLSGNNTYSGTNTFSHASTPILTDKIAERTAAAGVTIDSVLLKDGMATVAGTAASNGQIGYASNQFQAYRNGSLKNFLMDGDSSTRTVTARSSNTILAAADKGTVFICTSTFTQTVTAAATLGSGWYCYLRNDGSGVITIDPNSSETVNGATTITLPPGLSCILVCDGSNFKTIGLAQFSKNYDSSDQTITSAGALTLAHGLGVKPKLIQYILKCTSGNLGYSVGDEYDIGCGNSQNSVNTGLSSVIDATNINLRYGSAAAAFCLLNKGTGAGVSNIVNSSWVLIVRAWA